MAPAERCTHNEPMTMVKAALAMLSGGALALGLFGLYRLGMAALGGPSPAETGLLWFHWAGELILFIVASWGHWRVIQTKPIGKAVLLSALAVAVGTAAALWSYRT